MVELAISATALCLLMGGLVDLGRAYEFSVGLHNAAREGARHGAWFNETSKVNQYYYDTAIKQAVDDSLSGAGLPASVLKNCNGAAGCTNNSCPTTADGNTYGNPPYATSAYPTTTDTVWLYICYNATASTDYTAAPTTNTHKLEDLNVILLMNYGPMMGTFKDQIGNSIRIAGNAHVAVQGHP
jgi:Flp pilus assembly protein TadG